VILESIIAASRCTDADIVALRTSEIIEALLKTLTLALSPCARTPTQLRATSKTLAKRLRHLTREALADPVFQETRKSFFNGGDVGGHA
jgi:starvation-inducible outer membrane lipoprotein